MAVSKASILFFKFYKSDLVSFDSLSSNVKSCNSGLNSTKFSLRAVVASDHADHLVLDKDFTVFPLMADFNLTQRFVDAEKIYQNSEESQKMKQH